MTSSSNDDNNPNGTGEMTPAHGADHGRDGDVLRIMGVFFTILGTAVMLATQWDQWDEPPQALNIAAAVALILVGFGLFVVGRVLRRRSAPREDADSS